MRGPRLNGSMALSKAQRSPVRSSAPTPPQSQTVPLRDCVENKQRAEAAMPPI